MSTFYCAKNSLLAQSCLVLVKLLDVEIEIKEQELNFDDINPILKVPVFVHEELVLTEPRSIMIYIIESLKEGNSLYPSDFKKRATINQRLFYDAAVVFPSLLKLIRPIVLEKKKEIPQKHKDAFIAVIRVLEGLLANNDYFAGNEISLADISILTSVVLAIKLGLDLSQYKFLSGWYERLKDVLNFEEMLNCTEHTAQLVKSVTSVFE